MRNRDIGSQDRDGRPSIHALDRGARSARLAPLGVARNLRQRVRHFAQPPVSPPDVVDESTNADDKDLGTRPTGGRLSETILREDGTPRLVRSEPLVRWHRFELRAESGQVVGGGRVVATSPDSALRTAQRSLAGAARVVMTDLATQPAQNLHSTEEGN